MQPDTQMLNQPLQPAETHSLQHLSGDNALSNLKERDHTTKSPLKSQEVAQSGGEGAGRVPPLGSTSASKNRLITDFLPRLNTVPA